MSNLIDFARAELERIYYDNDEYGKMMADDVLEVLEVLCNQSHSGISAPVVIDIIKRLWGWKPLTPLTGEDNEWKECGDKQSLQNKRCPAVFKDKKTGKAHIQGARVFVEPNGVRFICRLSDEEITFPYTPFDKPKYIYLMHNTNEMEVDKQWEKGAYSFKPLPWANDSERAGRD